MELVFGILEWVFGIFFPLVAAPYLITCICKKSITIDGKDNK
jgi:hypothetical protein